MRVRSVLLSMMAGLVAAGPAWAAAEPVFGPADGMQATQSGVDLVVQFPGEAATRAAVVGKEVSASCERHPAPPTLAFEPNDDTIAAGPGTVAADGTVQLGLKRDVVVDTCEIVTMSSAVAVARVALTSAGEAWIDETIRATALHHLLDRARASGRYRPLAELGGGLVGLDGPEGLPAAGQTGYWTDGVRATVATLSASGRRLVIEDRGRGVLRTNVLQQSDPAEALDTYLSTEGGFEDAGDTKVARDPEIDGSRSPYRGERGLRGHDGIRIAGDGRHVTVRFTGRSAKTIRALAGRRVNAFCFARPAPSVFPSAFEADSVHRALARVPGRGGAVRYTFAAKVSGDVCVLVDDGTEIAVTSLTATGRRWLQDVEALALVLGDAEDVDHFAPSGATSYWPSETIVAHGHKVLMAMSGPGASVPVGRVGVWSDGARQAAEATLSASGRRFFIVDEGDGMVRTNVFGEIDVLVLGLLG
jgi:hypothetical protein